MQYSVNFPNTTFTKHFLRLYSKTISQDYLVLTESLREALRNLRKISYIRLPLVFCLWTSHLDRKANKQDKTITKVKGQNGPELPKQMSPRSGQWPLDHPGWMLDIPLAMGKKPQKGNSTFLMRCLEEGNRCYIL